MTIDSDIGKHFTAQLRRLTLDTIDTCRRADLDDHIVAAMLVTVLGHELALTGHIIGLDQPQFLDLCHDLWLSMQRRQRNRKQRP